MFAATPINPVIANTYATNKDIEEGDSVIILSIPTEKIRKLPTSVIMLRVLFFTFQTSLQYCLHNKITNLPQW
jgi:hypothetical protein